MNTARPFTGLNASVAEAAGSIGRARLTGASDQMRDDARNLLEVALSKRAVSTSFSKGNAAEGLLVAGFNADAAQKGKSVRAVWTHLTDCHAAADILLIDKGCVVGAAQVKTDQHAGRALRALRQDKYQGMQRVPTAEQFADIQEMAALRPMQYGQQDVLENLTDQLKFEGVRSGSVTNTAAERAAASPRRAAAGLRATATAREVGGATAKAGGAGAAMGGLLSGVGNARAVQSGEKAAIEALIDTAKDAARSGAQSAASAGLGATIAHGARRAGATKMAAGGAPVAIASCTLEITGHVRKHLNGELELAEFCEAVGRTSARAGAGFYGGLAGQALIPIPVLGGLIGSFVAVAVCDALADDATARSAATAHARAERDQLVRHALDEEARHRAELDQLIAAHADELTAMRDGLGALNRALARGDYNNAHGNLDALEAALGLTPIHYDDFVTAMSGSALPLEL